MDKLKKVINLPPQGSSDTPEGGECRAIVPGQASSSSNYGLSGVVLQASSTADNAIAQMARSVAAKSVDVPREEESSETSHSKAYLLRPRETTPDRGSMDSGTSTAMAPRWRTPVENTSAKKKRTVKRVRDEHLRGQGMITGTLDDAPIISGISPTSQPRGKRMRRKKVSSPDDSNRSKASSDEMGDLGPQCMSASTLGALAIEHLDNIEIIRKKCKNIKGDLTGKIRDLIVAVRKAVVILAEKVETKGDPTFLKMRCNELQIRNKELEKEISNLRTQRQKNPETKLPGKNKTQSEYVDKEMTGGMNKNKSKNKNPETKNQSSPRDEIEEMIDKQFESLIEARKRHRIKKFGKSVVGTFGNGMVHSDKTTPSYVAKTNWPSEDQYDTRKMTGRSNEGPEWTKVVPRRSVKPKKLVEGKDEVPGHKLPNKKMPTMRRRPPRTAAVVIKGRGDHFSYAEALKIAREKINLAEIGIERPKIRKAANGGLLIEVPGVNGTAKADTLAIKLKETLNDVSITRPIKKGDIRLLGLDDSITEEEIAWVIADIGNCSTELIRVSPMRPMRSGLRLTIVNCPLAAALATAGSGKVRIGWTMVKVELLEPRPVQCFRCWCFGHIGGQCKSQTVRQGSCFNCGQKEHMRNECNNKPCCPVCQENGNPHEHRIGSSKCLAKIVRSSNQGVKKRETKNA